MTYVYGADLSKEISDNLPFLRRYARALTGSQSSGDTYALAAIEAVIENPALFDKSLTPRVALFRVFHGIWSSSGGKLALEETGLQAKAQEHLSVLTSGTREALLLRTIEDFALEDVALVLSKTPTEAQELIDIAYAEMAKSINGSVMIIEDEAIIALDLEAIISEMGNRTTGVARTVDGALELFKKERPELILSDINLADGSSGIDAVSEIVKMHPGIPIIFITAYPEKLLTGNGVEPAFLITKPYSEAQVRSSISQAMFFSSTETLTA